MIKPFSTFIPPTLSILNKKLTILPTYEVVPDDTTLEEVNTSWTRKMPPPAPGFRATQEEMEAYLNGTYKEEDFAIKNISKEFKVPNSKGTGNYLVTYNNGTWDCNCVGFGFRRKCKHVQSCKSKI
jgi:hypothetical protein